MKTTLSRWPLALALLLAGAELFAADNSQKPPGDGSPPALSGPEQELARDTGISAGKRSIAGSGHAVRFEAPGQDWCLKAVRVFGSRYGQPAPPNENAYVWLCDTDFKLISAFPFPYANFQRGEPQWITIPVKPTRVPQKFVLCVGFNPTATEGVYVHHDSGAAGESFVALPGRTGQPFAKGNWLLRAVVQQSK